MLGVVSSVIYELTSPNCLQSANKGSLRHKELKGLKTLKSCQTNTTGVRGSFREEELGVAEGERSFAGAGGKVQKGNTHGMYRGAVRDWLWGGQAGPLSSHHARESLSCVASQKAGGGSVQLNDQVPSSLSWRNGG